MTVAAPRRNQWRLVRELFDDVPWSRTSFAMSVLCSVLASFSAVALMGIAGWLINRAAEQPPVMHLTAATVLVLSLIHI